MDQVTTLLTYAALARAEYNYDLKKQLDNLETNCS